MKPHYIFRLDDICPTMDWQRFRQLQALFDRYAITPILGVIPDNHDENLQVDPANLDFWNTMRQAQKKGWIIAQHGYRHLYALDDGGTLKIGHNSEFAGLPYQEQYDKIKAGKAILEHHLETPILWWMAPSHSFDDATLKALRTLQFRYITDGVSLYPFRQSGLLWLPQQLWRPRSMPFGTWTICLHPSTMTDKEFQQIEKFIVVYHQFCTVPTLVPRHSVFNPLFRFLWYRQLANIKQKRLSYER